MHSGGGYPLQFGTISVSDGISMGHEGMHFSLVSREVIADSVETVVMAERLDGTVLLAGCDKSIPGMLMARARLDLSSVFLYAGSIAPGWVKLSDGTEKDVTIIDSFEARRRVPGRQDERSRPQAHRVRHRPRRGRVRRHVHGEHDGLGRRGARASACPGSAAPPSADRRRDYLRAPLRRGRRQPAAPGHHDRATSSRRRRSRTRSPSRWRSAARRTSCCTCSRSPARREVDLTLHDFNRIGDKVPHIADMKPFGKYVMNDVDRHGGIPVIMKAMLDEGLLHGDALTVTGKTLAENLAELNPDPVDGDVIHTFDDPIHATGGITILHGSIAPEGAVVKSAGFDANVFEGPARVFERERAAMDALEAGQISARRRRRDPLRGPEGRSGHARDARDHRRHQGRWARKRCTTLDGRRFSGGTTGLCIGHIAPEAVDAGPIAFVRDGDLIRVDIAARTLDLLVDEAELGSRRYGWEPLPPRYTRGVLAKYSKLVRSAAEGAVTG